MHVLTQLEEQLFTQLSGEQAPTQTSLLYTQAPVAGLHVPPYSLVLPFAPTHLLGQLTPMHLSALSTHLLLPLMLAHL